jgi:hypothetical protein
MFGQLALFYLTAQHSAVLGAILPALVGITYITVYALLKDFFHIHNQKVNFC